MFGYYGGEHKTLTKEMNLKNLEIILEQMVLTNLKNTLDMLELD